MEIYATATHNGKAHSVGKRSQRTLHYRYTFTLTHHQFDFARQLRLLPAVQLVPLAGLAPQHIVPVDDDRAGDHQRQAGASCRAQHRRANEHHSSPTTVATRSHGSYCESMIRVVNKRVYRIYIQIGMDLFTFR